MYFFSYKLKTKNFKSGERYTVGERASFQKPERKMMSLVIECGEQFSHFLNCSLETRLNKVHVDSPDVCSAEHSGGAER